MKEFDRKNTEALQDGEQSRLPNGGYICKITAAEDVPDKEYIKIEFDIAAGEFKGYFADLYTRANFWGGRFVRSYKDTAQKFFNGFLTAVEKSNPGYQFDWNTKSLIGKSIGIVLGEEEYVTNTAEVKVHQVVTQVRDTEVIRSGNFKVPDLKPLDARGQARLAELKAKGIVGTHADGATVVNDEDLPF